MPNHLAISYHRPALKGLELQGMNTSVDGVSAAYCASCEWLFLIKHGRLCGVLVRSRLSQTGLYSWSAYFTSDAVVNRSN